jgi:dTDP-glucose 4,6-dehydratase
MKNILCLGGAGFIGSNFVDYIFKNTDWNITVVDLLNYRGRLDNFSDEVWREHLNYINGKKDSRFRFIYGDICDFHLMNKLFKENEYVVGFAAESHVDRSIFSSAPFIRSDVEGVQILLDVLKQNKHIEKFIHFSTSEVYGTAQYEPMDEQHPLLPASPYAASKCGGDRLIYSYQNTFDVPTTIVRPFNQYGPQQHAENLIPKCITSILNGKKIPIFGNGEAMRDFVFVKDTCEAILTLLNADNNEIKHKVFNIATGIATSTLDIARKIVKYMGQTEDECISFVDSRLGEVNKHIGCNKKMKSVFNWETKTTLDCGLLLTIEWYKSHLPWIANRKMYI